MTIRIEGDYEPIGHTITGLYSFDRAFANRGDIGLPQRSMVEMYGNNHIGKSTLAYYLSGALNNEGRILVCDFEGLDVDYLPLASNPSNFDGTIEIIKSLDNKNKARSHESMLTEFTSRIFSEEDVIAGIMDSVGSILPTYQREGEIGEGFGAKRAVVVAGLARNSQFALTNKPTPANIFVINHSHQIISGMGHSSAGGVVLKYLAGTRIFLRHSTKDFIKNTDGVLAYVTLGVVEKLRFGGKGRTFKFVTVPGYGVRPNLTAVQDAVDAGLATRGAVVKIREKSFGYISKLVAEDLEGNDELFDPFREVLNGSV